MSSCRVEASGTVPAPASKVFAIVSSPAGHVAIDGSGMLEAPIGANQPAAVGDTFDMDMDREPLGDIPEMGKYKVRNIVTQIIPDRLFEWNVGGIDLGPFGHVYGWAIEPIDDNSCKVTNYCDWTDVPAKYREAREWPIVPLSMLQQSVDRLRSVATESAG